MGFINKINTGGHIVGKPEGSKNSYSMVNWVFMIFWHNVSDFANRDKWLPSGNRWRLITTAATLPPSSPPKILIFLMQQWIQGVPILKHTQIHDPFVNYAEFKPKNPTFSPWRWNLGITCTTEVPSPISAVNSSGASMESFKNRHLLHVTKCIKML
jgi:hypothetical protein